MGQDERYLLILETGAGGYIVSADADDVREHAARIDGSGWLFKYQDERHMARRQRRIVELWLVTTFGHPDANALAAALVAAGKRHRVAYQLAVLDFE
jgi:hypothetical protein